MHQDNIDTVRSTNDRSLVASDDLMCWNIRRARIVQREVMAVGITEQSAAGRARLDDLPLNEF